MRSSTLTLVPVKRIRSGVYPTAGASATSFGKTASIRAPFSWRREAIPGWGLAFRA
jgi:hypothetical protein